MATQFPQETDASLQSTSTEPAPTQVTRAAPRWTQKDSEPTPKPEAAPTKKQQQNNSYDSGLPFEFQIALGYGALLGAAKINQESANIKDGWDNDFVGNIKEGAAIVKDGWNNDFVGNLKDGWNNDFVGNLKDGWDNDFVGNLKDGWNDDFVGNLKEIPGEVVSATGIDDGLDAVMSGDPLAVFIAAAIGATLLYAASDVYTHKYNKEANQEAIIENEATKENATVIAPVAGVETPVETITLGNDKAKATTSAEVSEPKAEAPKAESQVNAEPKEADVYTPSDAELSGEKKSDNQVWKELFEPEKSTAEATAPAASTSAQESVVDTVPEKTKENEPAISTAATTKESEPKSPASNADQSGLLEDPFDNDAFEKAAATPIAPAPQTSKAQTDAMFEQDPSNTEQAAFAPLRPKN